MSLSKEHIDFIFSNIKCRGQIARDHMEVCEEAYLTFIVKNTDIGTVESHMEESLLDIYSTMMKVGCTQEEYAKCLVEKEGVSLILTSRNITPASEALDCKGVHVDGYIYSYGFQVYACSNEYGLKMNKCTDVVVYEDPFEVQMKGVKSAKVYAPTIKRFGFRRDLNGYTRIIDAPFNIGV